MNQSAEALKAHLNDRKAVAPNSNPVLSQITRADVQAMLNEDMARHPKNRHYRYARKHGPHVKPEDTDR